MTFRGTLLKHEWAKQRKLNKNNSRGGGGAEICLWDPSSRIV